MLAHTGTLVTRLLTAGCALLLQVKTGCLARFQNVSHRERKLMSARKIPPASAKSGPSQSQFNPWTIAADFGRQQMTVATESAGAMLRGLDAIRKVQQQAGERAMMRHSAMLEKLKAAREPAQLLALQSQLLAVDAENASRYWQELGAAAMEMQTEMLGCYSHLVDSEALLEATAALDHLPSSLAGPDGFLGASAGQHRQ